jgi:hypothetical protein
MRTCGDAAGLPGPAAGRAAGPGEGVSRGTSPGLHATASVASSAIAIPDGRRRKRARKPKRNGG